MNSNNKKGMIGNDKLIIIIIVVLVVLSVFGFLFKADIAKVLRNIIPDFFVSVYDDDSGGNGDNIECEVVARIGELGKNIISLGDKEIIYINDKETNLYWLKNGNKIMLSQSLFSQDDVEIGVITDSIVKIYEEFLSNLGETRYNEFKDKGLPDIIILNNLDKSQLLKENYLCESLMKDITIISVEECEGSDVVATSEDGGGSFNGAVVSGEIKDMFISINNKKTNLYIDEDGKTIKLYIKWGFDIRKWGRDVPIGALENNIVKIETFFLNENTQSFKKYKEELPSVNDLKSLDGSTYTLDGSKVKLCRIPEKKTMISIEITEDVLVEMMNKYINQEGKNGCECGGSCRNYAKWIIKYSNENNLDSLLMLSLMIQESGCNPDVKSAYASFGLMEINLDTFNNYCKNYLGSKYSFDKIKLGEENSEQNMACGIKIFQKKYNEYKGGVLESNTYKSNSAFRKIINSCIKKYPEYGDYRNYDATLRSYNGWGCTVGADLNYVKKVNKIKEDLLKIVSS